MWVILVKLIMLCSASGGGGGVEELADLGPGEFLVAGVVDGLGQELLGLGDEAGQGVQPDGGAAEPAGSAEPGELAGRLVEDVAAGQRSASMADHLAGKDSYLHTDPSRGSWRTTGPGGSRTVWSPLVRNSWSACSSMVDYGPSRAVQRHLLRCPRSFSEVWPKFSCLHRGGLRRRGDRGGR